MEGASVAHVLVPFNTGGFAATADERRGLEGQEVPRKDQQGRKKYEYQRCHFPLILADWTECHGSYTYDA